FELGDVSLRFCRRVSAVKLRDLAQEREAFRQLGDEPTGRYENESGARIERERSLAIIFAPREDLVAGRVVGLAVRFSVQLRVREELAAVVSVGRLPEAETVAGAQNGKTARDAVPSAAVELELIDERSAGAVGVARPDDGQPEPALFCRAFEDSFAGQLVPTVMQDR